MMQGRFNEAVKILMDVAKTNKSSLPPREELDALRDSFELEVSRKASMLRIEGKKKRKKV